MKRYIKSAVVNPMDEDQSDLVEIARLTDSDELLHRIFNYMRNNAYTWGIALALLDNPNTPEDMVQYLLGTDYYARQYAVSGKLPDRLRYIANNSVRYPSHYTLEELIAQNPNLPSDILDEYLYSSKLRGYVAMNPNLSSESIESLAHSQNNYMRSCVTMNPAISSELLTELSTDPDEEVRAGVANHSNTPVEVLQRLAEDEISGVRLVAKATLREEYGL